MATVGNVTEDAIRKYIQEQSEESRKEVWLGNNKEHFSNGDAGTSGTEVKIW